MLENDPLDIDESQGHKYACGGEEESCATKMLHRVQIPYVAAHHYLFKAEGKGCVPPLASGVGLKWIFSNPEEDLQEVIQIWDRNRGHLVVFSC